MTGGERPDAVNAGPGMQRPEQPDDGESLLDPKARVRFLLEANAALRSSPALEECLPALARQTVPLLADWTAIDLVEPEGVFQRVAVAHADPARAEAARRLEGRYTPRAEAGWGPQRAVERGRVLYFPHITEPRLLATEDSPDGRARVRALGLGAVLCAPVPGLRDAPVQGVLSYVRMEPRRPFAATEQATIRTLASRVAEVLAYGRVLRELQAAARAKDEFIAMLGHELRNPIAAVRQAIHALERLGSLDPAEAALHGIIDRQTLHLARLIDDLLDVARLTSGRITLRRTPVDLREAVERSLAIMRAARHGHDVVLEGPCVVVDADPTRLDQILGNLLENAFKYTAPGGRIDVTVGQTDVAGVVRIRDTGIGIPPDILPRIFEPFTQGGQSLARERGGLGIGLTLVRRLVELHGGTVALSSQGLGRGTTVEVRLPRGTAASTEVAGAASGSGDRRGRTVLIVEDNGDVREALRWLLESEGHRVLIARDGREAIEHARASAPDVALVDIGLPGINGYDLAHHLRATPGGSSLRMIALTGYSRAEDRRRTHEAGFDAHLIKPVEPEELLRLLAGDDSQREDAAG